MMSMLHDKPWEATDAPQEIYFPRGMVGNEERRMLYYLATEYFRGEGVIVDAGAFLGASTFAFASGLNSSQYRGHSKIEAYDLFEAQQPYVVDSITRDFLKVERGYDFYPLFQWQTATYSDLIASRKGDFLTIPPPQGPIEILFVDIAQTFELNQRITEAYFSRLLPGRSLVIQRDIYHPWHPYVQITMEALSDYFEIVDQHVIGSSRLYLLTKAIPERSIKKVLQWFSFDEEMLLLRQAIEKETGSMRMMFRVAEVLNFVTKGGPEEALKAARQLREDSEFDPGEWYATQLELVEIRIRETADLLPASS